MLLYLLQAQLSLRGSNPLQDQYDASVLRAAFTVKCEGWNEQASWNAYDQVDGRDSVWTMVRNGYIVKNGVVSFKYPHDIVGV